MSNFANATTNAVETVSISSAKKASSGYKTTFAPYPVKDNKVSIQYSITWKDDEDTTQEGLTEEFSREYPVRKGLYLKRLLQDDSGSLVTTKKGQYVSLAGDTTQEYIVSNIPSVCETEEFELCRYFTMLFLDCIEEAIEAGEKVAFTPFGCFGLSFIGGNKPKVAPAVSMSVRNLFKSKK